MSKLPPQNIEAEKSVIGALLIDKDAIIRIADLLRPEDFYTPAHAMIYEAILGLYEKSEPIDLLTITNELKEKKQLERIGGSSYLTGIIDMVPTASHIEHYAKMVKEKNILRNLIKTSAEITETAFSPTEDIADILNDIEQKIFGISQHSVGQKFLSIKHDLSGAYERIEKLHSGEGATRGVPTGFPEIDSLLSGWQRSDLVILGARPSVGKTSLALDFLRHAGVNEGIPVGMFSIEMSREQVIDRLISTVGNVPLWKLRTGRLQNDNDFENIQRALDTLSKASIFIDDSPNPTILEMRSMARRLKAEHGLGLILVDYLQLVQSRNQNASTVQQVTEISRGLKAIARELNVPVIALSQLSRATTQRDNKVPRLSDLRDSGSIEQDADVVMFIYRKDYHGSDIDPAEEGMAEVIIAKHRNGPLGNVKLRFDKEVASFRSIDTRHEPPPQGF